MNKQWLETFICVHDTQSVGRAAEVLFLTPSTVSSRLQALENEIGEPLFTHVGKKLVANETGRTLHPYAIRILDEWNRCREAIYELKHTVKGTLTIALFYAVIPLFAPHFITFQQKFPDIKLAIKTMHSDEIGGYLQSNIVHAGIVRKTEGTMFDFVTLLLDSFVLAVYPGHPFAEDPQRFAPEALERERIIFLNSGTVYKELLGNLMGGKIKENCIVAETDNVDVCKQYVVEKQGIAFMPRFSVLQELKKGTLIAIEQEPLQHVNRSVDLIWMKAHSNFLVSVFVEHMMEHFEHGS